MKPRMQRLWLVIAADRVFTGRGQQSIQALRKRSIDGKAVRQALAVCLDGSVRYASKIWMRKRDWKNLIVTRSACFYVHAWLSIKEQSNRQSPDDSCVFNTEHMNMAQPDVVERRTRHEVLKKDQSTKGFSEVTIIQRTNRPLLVSLETNTFQLE